MPHPAWAVPAAPAEGPHGPNYTTVPFRCTKKPKTPRLDVDRTFPEAEVFPG